LPSGSRLDEVKTENYPLTAHPLTVQRSSLTVKR